MPFIRGRYHINPMLGEALEAAREAENALVALEQEEEHGKESGKDASRGEAPIHRVEIEAAELVPSHSGRGGRGYVARVHRQAASPQDGEDDFAGAGGKTAKSGLQGASPCAAGGSQPETHVFANHGDLVNFLHDALGDDAAQQ
jgi:hypothetical protein